MIYMVGVGLFLIVVLLVLIMFQLGQVIDLLNALVNNVAEAQSEERINGTASKEQPDNPWGGLR